MTHIIKIPVYEHQYHAFWYPGHLRGNSYIMDDFGNSLLVDTAKNEQYMIYVNPEESEDAYA